MRGRFRLLYRVGKLLDCVLGGDGLFERLHHVKVHNGVVAGVCCQNFLVVHCGLCLVCREKVEGDYSGDYNYKGNYQFKARRKYYALLPFREARRAEGSLNDVLVEAPIVEIGNPQANYESRPRNFRVVGWQEHRELVGIEFEEFFKRSGVGKRRESIGRYCRGRIPLLLRFDADAARHGRESD